MRAQSLAVLATVALAVNSAPSLALDVNGQLEWEWAYASAEQRQQKNQLQVELEFNQEFGAAYITGIARLKTDGLAYLQPGSQSSQGKANRAIQLGGKTELSLRELYLDFDWGQAQWRLGKQQQVWGQADGLKVLDRVNPQDFSEFILDEFEDSRLPLWMLAVEKPLSNSAALQLLWIPDNSYHRLAAAGTDFDLLAGVHQQGLAIKGKKPGKLIKDSNIGLRYSDFVQGWDVSVNYLYHYNDFPSQYLQLDAEGPHIDARYQRNHLIGASVSNAFDELTVRAEVGINSHQYFSRRDGQAGGQAKSAEFSSVLGLDWHGFSDTLLSLQWFQSSLLQYQQGIVRDKIEHTASFLYEQKFNNETITFRTLALHSLNQGDGLFRPKLKFNLSSDIDIWFGADIFYGSGNGLYGQFKQKDRVLFGIELGF